MAEYELLLPSDVRLNQLANEVAPRAISSERITTIITAMTRILLGQENADDTPFPSLAGLAATQIGARERIFIIDMNADGKTAHPKAAPAVWINPRITFASPKENVGYESCFSTGNFVGAVLRASQVTIAGINESGTPVSKSLEGFLARVAQHELDHLNGIRLIDRIRDPSHLDRLDFDIYESSQYTPDPAEMQGAWLLGEWLNIKNGNAATEL